MFHLKIKNLWDIVNLLYKYLVRPRWWLLTIEFAMERCKVVFCFIRTSWKNLKTVTASIFSSSTFWINRRTFYQASSITINDATKYGKALPEDTAACCHSILHSPRGVTNFSLWEVSHKERISEKFPKLRRRTAQTSFECRLKNDTYRPGYGWRVDGGEPSSVKFFSPPLFLHRLPVTILGRRARARFQTRTSKKQINHPLSSPFFLSFFFFFFSARAGSRWLFDERDRAFIRRGLDDKLRAQAPAKLRALTVTRRISAA